MPKISSAKENIYTVNNLIVAEKKELITDTIYKQARLKYTNAVNASILKTLLQPATTLKGAFNTVAKEDQIFCINPKTDTTIICKEGTVLKIKPATFLVVSTGVAASENIMLQVKEFYKISDIILADLSTESKDNIIETGGMLFIKATSNGQDCILKDNLPIEISFPYAEKKDSMLLFAGRWKQNKIDWEQFSMQTSPKKDSFEMPRFNGDFESYFKRNINYDNPDDSGINERVLVELEIEETGKAQIVKVTRTGNQLILNAINRFIAKMPLWQPGKNNGVPVKLTVRIPLLFINGAEETNDSLYKEGFEKIISDSTINDQKLTKIRRYVFSTSKLGWLNCDRFYNDGKPKADININCGDYNDIEVKMVFHSFRSILEGEAVGSVCKFYNIPKNEKVTIVAIKKNKSKTYISLQEYDTNAKVFDDLIFEEVSINKLKEKIAALNELK